MLGRLDDDVAGRVEAGPARAAGDLVELADPQDPLPAAVELRETGEQHGPDRDVDADAEGVGAADDGEQAGLGELLDQPPVARQHPGVVDADPAAQQLGQRLAEAGAEPEAGQPLLDLVLGGALLVEPSTLGVEQRGRVLDGVLLGEVHDVDRGLVGAHQLLERLGERRRAPR